MGSTRSWAADMEDETVVCKYGVERKYFDTCRCDGCKADAELGVAVEAKAREVMYIALEFFRKLPREQWDSVVSLRIK